MKAGNIWSRRRSFRIATIVAMTIACIGRTGRAETAQNSSVVQAVPALNGEGRDRAR